MIELSYSKLAQAEYVFLAIFSRPIFSMHKSIWLEKVNHIHVSIDASIRVDTGNICDILYTLRVQNTNRLTVFENLYT